MKMQENSRMVFVENGKNVEKLNDMKNILWLWRHETDMH